MFERTCEKKINPFDEFFWFVSEYNLKFASGNLISLNEQVSVTGLNEAYDFISKKYADDLHKLYSATMCYELFCYFYCERKDSRAKYELFRRLLENVDRRFEQTYSYWTRASYSSFIEVDQRGYSPVTWGNLLYFNDSAIRFVGGEFKNTRFIQTTTISKRMELFCITMNISLYITM